MDYNCCSLNEKDSLQDMLNLEKTMVKVYGTVITEGCSKEFRKVVQENLNENINDQIDVYFMMTEGGYSQVTTAEEEQVSMQREKFNEIKNQLN
ncbi:MAG: spore coat protein [Clostridia bacterium]|nr:spore coat protein [Clostridia bacterium]